MSTFKAHKQTTTDSQPVVIEGHELGPSAFTVTGWEVLDDGSDGGARAAVEVRWNGSRYVADAVRVTAPGGVTTDLLRALSVDEFLKTGVKMESLYREGVIGSRPDVSDGPTDENLRAVALQYRLAYALGAPPTQAVAQGIGLNPNTAARWVMKAREKGFLSPTEKGRAGA